MGLQVVVRSTIIDFDETLASRGDRKYQRGTEPFNLLERVVLACTLASPAECHEYHLMVQSAGSLRACTMQAEPYLAQWISDHPNLRVARWHCAWPGREGEGI